LAADAYLLGMDGMAILEGRDTFQIGLMGAIVSAANDRIEEREKRLAAYIANEVAKRFK
jgi:hypothetical protein